MIRGLFFLNLLLIPALVSAQQADDSKPGDVLLTEVMADPSGLTALPQTEYVEIYNASGNDISLDDWVFVYMTTETALPDVVLPAGGYAVLYRSGRDITVAPGALSLGIDKFPFALANDGRTIAIKNSQGDLIDEMTYPKAKPDKSYERSDDGTWHESTDEKGGTPGAANSPSTPQGNSSDNSKPGDVLLTEVMADPNGLTALPQTEYVEIYNASGDDISLNGWFFVYMTTETALPDVVLPAGGYAVLYRSGRDITVAPGALSLGIDKFPFALANDGRTIAIKNSKGELIDEMTYPKAKPGKSYERADDGTWHESTDEKGGTPGAANSSSTSSGNGDNPDPDPDPDPNPDPNPDNSKPGDILFTEVMADPNGLTALPQTEYVEVYNASGDDISLNGWVFIYMTTETALPDVVLPAGGYAVLYRSGRDITVAPGALSLGIDKFPSALANDGRTIVIKNSQGELIDEMTYPKAKPGKSYERAEDGTWHESTDEKGGTPGAANSPPPSPGNGDNPGDGDNSGNGDNPDNGTTPDIDNSRPGDVIITEVMANPNGLQLLPETEYVEIFNASGGDISLKNWVFVYDGKDTKLPDVLLPAGSYAVLYRSPRAINVAPGAMVLGIDNFPSALANTGKTIGLKNTKDELIDEMTYSTAKAGKSFERADDGSWYVSTDEKGGTPGAANSPPPSPGNGDNQGNGDNPGDNPDNGTIPDTDNSRPGDVLINEVMANPVGLTALPETEYVEIYNASEADLPLHGWVFIYDGKETVLPNVVLTAGGYAVLYRAGRPVTVAAGALSLGIDNFPSAIANTTKTLGLKNSKGVLIDEMTYPNAKAAKSYERDDTGSWHESTDSKGGTPGAANSPPPSSNTEPDPGTGVVNPNDNSKRGDVLINEVMANPVGLTALPETEYIEIYNVTGAAVSLNGWTFLYDGRETLLPDVVLAARSYAVLYRAGREINVTSGALILGLDKFPSALANTGKTIGLKNSKGVFIDEMTYPSAKAGKSYERAGDGSWHLSTDEKGGTPGAVNSSPPASGDGENQPIIDNSKTGDVLINEVMANPVGLTALPETEYVEIYNTSGTDISLNGWVFMYDDKETPLPDVVLPDDGLAVLYRTGREINVASGALALGLDNFPSALANTGKTIGLKNSKGDFIDEMTYPSAKAGKSYERNDDGTWHLSTDEKGGTPGATNSKPSSSGTDTGTDPDDNDPDDDDGDGDDGNGDDDNETGLPIDNSQPGDILINEVMANPVGLTELPETEYVEIVNISEDDISLNGWVFIYDGKDTPLPDTLLSTGGYAVLYRSGHEISVASGALSLGIEKFPSALANTGKTIGLKNSKGDFIDEMTYPTAKAGKSYERANDGTWHLSTDEKGGTPGAVNSPPTTPGSNPDDSQDSDTNEGEIAESLEVIINEILPDPYTGGSEYIELYNRSDRPLSLVNLAIAVRKADGSLSTHYPLNSIKKTISPDNYVVLTKEYRGVADYYSLPSDEPVYELKLPALNNEGASIVLFRIPDEVIIDEVTYSTKWHSASIKNKKGVSLERIDPNKDSQDASNWTSATVDAGYGTPGYKNSQYKNPGLQEKTYINSPEYISGFDYYILSYQASKPDFRCRIEIYTTNGKKVAELTNNRLISQEGEIRWDGKGLDNSRLTPGVYVFYAEMYHPDGDFKKFKKAFLVR